MTGAVFSGVFVLFFGFNFSIAILGENWVIKLLFCDLKCNLLFRDTKNTCLWNKKL